MVFLLLFLAACASTNGNVELEVDENSHIVIDSVDRQVVLPKEINRVGVTFAATGHMIAILGEGDKIVTVNNGLKRDKLLIELVPRVLEVPGVKQGGKINFEELARMKPEVVLIDLGTYSDDGQVKKLEQLDIPFLVVNYDTIEEQMKAIEMMGIVVGAEETAKKYLDYYNETLVFLAERVGNLPDDEKRRVYHAVNEATRTSVPGTTSYEFLEHVGAINVAADVDMKNVENNHYVSLEQILEWNPEVILVNEDGVEEYILMKEQWKNIDAVINEEVYLLPNGLTRWGHPNSVESPIALLYIAKLLYEDAFQDVDIEKEIYDFYHTYFSAELTDEQISEIISGKGMRLRKGEE